MPSPKNGIAGMAVLPAAPRLPLEADHADPGQVDQAKASQRDNRNGKYGAAPTKPHKWSRNGNGNGNGTTKRKSWIEIELVDRQNKPVPGEPYRIILPDDQTVAEGTLDEKGFARVDGIDPGTCRVTFPNLEKQAWKPK